MRKTIDLLASLSVQGLLLLGIGILCGIAAGSLTLWVDIPFAYAANGGMWVGFLLGAYLIHRRRTRAINASN